MTIHAAPIPYVKTLWRALFAEFSDGEPWHSPDSEKSIQFYSRGMRAMEEGVITILDKRDKKNGKVWLPDYFCNEPLAPFRNKEINLHLYPIKNDLSPDWARIDLEVKRSCPPDVFILVHYFGFPNCLGEARAFCDKYGTELLEDCAHLLLSANGYGQNMAFFSPRKLLALPEGGLLIISNKSSVQQPKKRFVASKKLIFKWLVRRLTQRMMLTMGISWHHFRKTVSCNLHNNHANQLSGSTGTFPDTYTLKLLAVMEKGFNLVIEKRRANYMRLLRAVEGIKKVRPLFSLFPDYVCPYVFPVIVSDGRDTALRRLNHFGIPATSWPDLPPEVLQKCDEHKTAIWLQEHIILLPVHQDLSYKQVEYMAFKLREILKHSA
ncbi:MAG: DegT/DnrJ/EryC1/StrS family aminotransferase [bacterium]